MRSGGRSVALIRTTTAASLKSGKSSRPRILARTSHPNCASRKTGCAPRWGHANETHAGAWRIQGHRGRVNARPCVASLNRKTKTRKEDIMKQQIRYTGAALAVAATIVVSLALAQD